MSFGEAGSLSTNSPVENMPISVTLTEPLSDPVFALSGTNTGGDPFVFRIVDQVLDANGDTTSFSFIIEEWEFLDGPHGATETITWLAVEEGIHTLPDGRIVEAGTTSATSANSTVTLNGGFLDPPVVLTSVMSENELTTVDSDPFNISGSGFSVSLQEEEGEDGTHIAETVGYIAIQTGGDVANGLASTVGGVDENIDTLALGGTFSDAVTLVKTQTINGGDPGRLVLVNPTNSNVGVFFQEETSANSEVNHVDETVGLITFESGLLVCLTNGTLVRTDQGEMAVEHITPGVLVETLDHGPQPVLRILKREILGDEQAQNPKLRPIKFAKGCLGQGLPSRELAVSAQHRMLVKGKLAQRMFGQSEVLVAAKSLTKLDGIQTDTVLKDVTYYHLVFADHQVIFAENAPTESFYLGLECQKGLPAPVLQEFEALFGGAEVARAKSQKLAPTRLIPSFARQRRFAHRLAKNRKSVLQAQK